MTRQIILDTETTGLEIRDGHRIIEIGAVELLDRKLTGYNYHQYINPQRAVDAGAVEIHGITNDRLQDEPVFADIVEDFISYVDGAELIIHNAPFDVGFLDHELSLSGRKRRVENDLCVVTDTLKMARKKYPGQRNTLDALCSRLEVNNGHRKLHGALLDSEILADVYLAMTRVQNVLSLDDDTEERDEAAGRHEGLSQSGPLPVIHATAEEVKAHQEWLARLEAEADGGSLWSEVTASPAA